jgi:hypothetical protein
MIHGVLHLVWWLIVGHALADFVLQSTSMAIGKSRHHHGAPGEPPWYYWLTSHALMHGGVVGLIAGSAVLGVAEFVAHWLIDFGKCERLYGFNTDQAFHLICKLVWIWLIFRI